MSVVSMTGYGRGTAKGRGVDVLVEISSVNRKQFDLRVNLPRHLMSLDTGVNEVVRGTIGRGSISCGIKVTSLPRGTSARGRLNEQAAMEYLRNVRTLARKMKLKDDLTSSSLLGVTSSLSFEEDQVSPEEIWPVMKTALIKALKGLSSMRKSEGMKLQADMEKRLNSLRALLTTIKKNAGKSVKRHRSVLEKRLKSAGCNLAKADGRLINEIVIYADRCDISEEIVRLQSHFAQAGELIGSKKPAGRPLDFLCQEMFREINTIGSKANDSTISRCVVDFKATLESIREQVQNME